MYNSINNTLVSGTSYADTITNYAHHVTIQTGAGNDSIFSYNMVNSSYTAISSRASYSLIDAGDGNDNIKNFGNDHCTVYGGNGNDSITNTGQYSTIFGGVGNDTMWNWESGWSDYSKRDQSYYSVLDGGDGNDYIGSGYGQYNTLIGGTGNDTIKINNNSSYNLIYYDSGDGNDIVYGFGSSDTICLTGGDYSTYSTQKSGSDTIIKVGRGQISVKNYTGNVNIVTPF